VRVTPVTALYVSLTATGAAFVTVMVTSVEITRRPDGWYRNVSVPT